MQPSFESAYRQEVAELDATLESLWATVPDDARVVFCGDHGELGEDGLWGHPGEMRPELLNVLFGTRNAPDLGEVVSLIDVPTILTGVEHRQGRSSAKSPSPPTGIERPR